MDTKHKKSSCLCTGCISDRNQTICFGLFPRGDLTIEINMFDCFVFQIRVNKELTLMDVIEKVSGVEFQTRMSYIDRNSSVFRQTQLAAVHSIDNISTCIKNISEQFFCGTQVTIPSIYLEQIGAPQSGPTAARPKKIH